MTAARAWPTPPVVIGYPTQARRDLESARVQQREGFYEWACFIAQQAAEKAVKAVYQKKGGEAWGHVVSDLMKGLSDKTSVPEPLIDKAKQLDRFYIPSRYPNGWAAGTPAEFITRGDAESAIGNSEEIIQFCSRLLA